MRARLEFTDSRFVFAGRSYPDIPLLVDGECRFVTAVCDYLRYMVTMDQLTPSSAKTYAEYILHFWRYLEDVHIDFTEVCDQIFVRWLNQQKLSGVSAATRAARCDTVFALYVWLERNGYVHQFVAIPGWNDAERFAPKLTAVPARHMRTHRRCSKIGIVSAVRPRAPRGDIQPTPTDDEVSKIYIEADNPDDRQLTDRNHLLIDWCVQVGLRRLEYASLTVGQIPSWDDIHTLHERCEALELKLVKTKGGRVRHVGVLPELLAKTRDYIEGPRAELVARFTRRKSVYREPQEVFLSTKTGQPMTLKGITNLFTRWFDGAGVEGHGHRLRAVFLTNLFEAEIAAEEARMAAFSGTKTSIDYELILRKVAERAGHAHLESLRAYLTNVRKRGAQSQLSADPVTLDQMIEARRHELRVLEQRIERLQPKSH